METLDRWRRPLPVVQRLVCTGDVAYSSLTIQQAYRTLLVSSRVRHGSFGVEFVGQANPKESKYATLSPLLETFPRLTAVDNLSYSPVPPPKRTKSAIANWRSWTSFDNTETPIPAREAPDDWTPSLEHSKIPSASQEKSAARSPRHTYWDDIRAARPRKASTVLIG